MVSNRRWNIHCMSVLQFLSEPTGHLISEIVLLILISSSVFEFGLELFPSKVSELIFGVSLILAPCAATIVSKDKMIFILSLSRAVCWIFYIFKTNFTLSKTQVITKCRQWFYSFLYSLYSNVQWMYWTVNLVKFSKGSRWSD